MCNVLLNHPNANDYIFNILFPSLFYQYLANRVDVLNMKPFSFLYISFSNYRRSVEFMYEG